MYKEKQTNKQTNKQTKTQVFVAMFHHMAQCISSSPKIWGMLNRTKIILPDVDFTV